MGEDIKFAGKSKTLWINAALTVVAFFPQVQAILTPETVGAIFGLVNTVLRFLTTKPITLKK